MIVTFAGYDIKVGTPVVSRDGAEVGTVARHPGRRSCRRYPEQRAEHASRGGGVAAFEPDFIRLDLTAAQVAGATGSPSAVLFPTRRRRPSPNPSWLNRWPPCRWPNPFPLRAVPAPSLWPRGPAPAAAAPAPTTSSADRRSARGGPRRCQARGADRCGQGPQKVVVDNASLDVDVYERS